MMKKLFHCCVCAVGILFSSLSTAGGFSHSVEYGGRELAYAYYVPGTVTAEPDAIILVPGLNGRGESMINSKWLALSESTGRPIIAPSFVFEGNEAFQKNESYQYPQFWSGGALNAIFDQFAEKGIHIQHLYMAGFSAGAQFVGRYSLAHPDQVTKCAIGASGGNDPVDYASPVRFFYAVGENDEKHRRENADNFVNQAEGYGVSVEWKIYPHTGHSFTGEMEDDFIRFLTD